MSIDSISKRYNSDRKLTGVQVGGIIFILAGTPIVITRIEGPAYGALPLIFGFLILYMSRLSRAFAARKIVRILYPALMVVSYSLSSYFYFESNRRDSFELPLIIALCGTVLLLILEYNWTTGFMSNDSDATVDNHPLYVAIKSIFHGK